MLDIQLPPVLLGRVVVECRGMKLASFLNLITKANIRVYDIYWVDEHRLKMTVLLSQFYELVKLMKQNQVRMRILHKSGLPFYMEKAKKRKWFYVGAILFLFSLYGLTSFIWNVDIEGNKKIPASQIQNILKQEGVFVGQWKRRLPDTVLLQENLLRKMDDTSWVGVRTEGTRMIITIVEKKVPEPNDDQAKIREPVHLIAKKNALIYEMKVDRGNPKVKVNDMVKKGQILVSGIYGDGEQNNTNQIAGAKASILGEVWYESEIEIPLVQKKKVYSGYREKGRFPYVFRFQLKNPFFSPPYKQYEQIQQIDRMRVGNWELPFGIIEEQYLEMQWVRSQLSEEEGIKLGLEQAKLELLADLGKGSQIVAEKILHHRQENGKVYVKVHFDVVENITEKQPIFQGE
ncbi:sporulation protein YqfD [Hazenella sp. IB182353]|uniref:sporulation protein YqfD n=1 Tax=Polycladospora coralii TaxID=2771432 RepID=UPI00174783A3|nr:sporulation protein YqfD [Polycladospora coralii]MBS7530107.1 sporulation protein YqfD [Polycladospora coralii]